MKKVDFSKIVVRDIDGNQYMTTNGKEKVPYDFAKILGNGLFYQGKDIRLAEIGQKMYHHEEVELTDEEVASVREFIEKGFVPFVLLSALPQFDEMTK